MDQRTPLLSTQPLRDLLSFWRARCSVEDIPLSAEVAPQDIRAWMPNIVIMQALSDERFVYAFYGRSFTRAFGESHLGQTLDQLPEAQRALLHDEYRRACRERRPVARIYTADFDGETQTWERLVLPLRSDGETVDKLLVAAYRM